MCKLPTVLRRVIMFWFFFLRLHLIWKSKKCSSLVCRDTHSGLTFVCISIGPLNSRMMISEQDPVLWMTQTPCIYLSPQDIWIKVEAQPGKERVCLQQPGYHSSCLCVLHRLSVLKTIFPKKRTRYQRSIACMHRNHQLMIVMILRLTLFSCI